MNFEGLYNIIDNTVKPYLDHLDIAKEVLKGGGRIIQLRAKGLSSKEFFKKAIEIRKLVKGDRIFIINDRVDIAIGCGADGVHIGQEDPPLREIRRIYDGIIGVSTHSKEEALRAYEDGANYISFGPIFETPTKRDALSPRGLSELMEIKKIIPIPVVAIGGINESNIYEVLNTGIEGIAIISAIIGAPDISKKTLEFKQIIDSFKKRV